MVKNALIEQKIRGMLSNTRTPGIGIRENIPTHTQSSFPWIPWSYIIGGVVLMSSLVILIIIYHYFGDSCSPVNGQCNEELKCCENNTCDNNICIASPGNTMCNTFEGCGEHKKLIQDADVIEGDTEEVCCRPSNCQEWNEDTDIGCEEGSQIIDEPFDVDGYSSEECCVEPFT